MINGGLVNSPFEKKHNLVLGKQVVHKKRKNFNSSTVKWLIIRTRIRIIRRIGGTKQAKMDQVKFVGRQPLKKLKWYMVWKAVFYKFNFVHSWTFCFIYMITCNQVHTCKSSSILDGFKSFKYFEKSIVIKMSMLKLKWNYKAIRFLPTTKPSLKQNQINYILISHPFISIIIHIHYYP